jgi:hypothetical protein
VQHLPQDGGFGCVGEHELEQVLLGGRAVQEPGRLVVQELRERKGARCGLQFRKSGDSESTRKKLTSLVVRKEAKDDA